ncbi:MAG: flippase-like domain-containing protein, partial [Myxococcota bacterium]|nr:flippase-like domain-containing protein [Myxococcota bacterium]
MKKGIRFFIACLISAILLWFLFKDIAWSEVFAQMQEANHTYTLLCFALLTLMNAIKIYRWRLLLNAFVQIGYKDLFRIGGLGFFLVLLLPLRLGEFSRPYLLKKEKGASFSSTMATIALERALDGLF